MCLQFCVEIPVPFTMHAGILSLGCWDCIFPRPQVQKCDLATPGRSLASHEACEQISPYFLVLAVGSQIAPKTYVSRASVSWSGVFSSPGKPQSARIGRLDCLHLTLRTGSLSKFSSSLKREGGGCRIVLVL